MRGLGRISFSPERYRRGTAPIHGFGVIYTAVPPVFHLYDIRAEAASGETPAKGEEYPENYQKRGANKFSKTGKGGKRASDGELGEDSFSCGNERNEWRLRADRGFVKVRGN